MIRNRGKILGLSLFLCILCGYAFPDLEWPLKEKTYITGSFGEFRKNHIHAGIDISTRGKIGIPVYASDSGVLYRIKIEHKGFGKAVYVKLSNGNYLVYAHLSGFSPQIEEIAEKEQQKKDSYSVDFLPSKKVVINKGSHVGYSGDTGGVDPHLHLELRDPNERPLNILKHGLNMQDKHPLKISGVAVCDTSDTRCIQFYNAKNIPKEININEGEGLAVAIHNTGGKNKIGIYRLELIIDGKIFFTVKTDSFSYDNFYDNFLLCNKDLYVNHNRIYYHLFKAFSNNLSFYPAGSDGMLNLSAGKHSISINAIDTSDNKSTLSFNIIVTQKKSEKKYKPEKGIWYSPDKLCTVNINAKDLYYPLKVKISERQSKQKYRELIPVSKIYTVIPKEAIFKKAAISIKQHSNIEKVGLYKYEDSEWKLVDEKPIRNFTQFALFRDVTPPTIKIISTHPIFRAKIEDNGSGLDYKKLSLTLDNNETIAEYSINKRELCYKTPSKRHKITIIAVDKMGNICKKEVEF